MRRWYAWTIAGLVIGAIAAFVVVGAAGAGHGTYVPAAILFPFTMLIASWAGSIGPPLIGLALAQFPVYGLIVAGFKDSQRALLYVLGVHAAAVVLAAFAVASSDAF